MLATIEPTTLAGAQETHERTEAQIAEWREKRSTLAAQLVQAEQGAAAAAVSGSATAKIAGEIVKLREEIHIADGALALLTSQHEETAYALRVAEQRDRRERYEALGVEAAALWARVAELWAPLGELTGAGPDILADRLPKMEGIEARREALRREINYRDDFLRPEDQEGSL